MLTSRPVIFISAVSRELRTTRDLVAKNLIALGYEPKWQDIAPTETGDLRAVLRKWVDESHAVLQIVGHRYGFVPDQPDETFGQVSYTQYEALYAKAKGKKVWYIILDEHHTVDCPDDEHEVLKKLQSDYRIKVKAHHGLYHTSNSIDRTEIIVLKLRDDLAILRNEYIDHQRKQDDALSNIQHQNEVLLAAIRELPRAVAEAQQATPMEDENACTARAYCILEGSHKLPPGTLARELPAFAKMLLLRADTSEMDRASALFATKQYAQSEAAALRAKDHALAAAGQPVKDATAALVLAGQSATEQIQYKRALDHYRAAAALTSEERDTMGWIDIQNKIGWLLYRDGQYDAQVSLMNRVWQTCEKKICHENPFALQSRNIRAAALSAQGKHGEAEQEHRVVLSARKRVLGCEHPDTLASQNNLALELDNQGKYIEAEKEYRAVLVVMNRVLGAQHLLTLTCRMNLGVTLQSQKRYAEAEGENRAVLRKRKRVLGSEHPDTLISRNNLALALHAQGKKAEAEEEHRAVLRIRKRVLGYEHPDTLTSWMNLAIAMNSQGKHTGAEEEHLAVLTIRERVLGLEHPHVYSSCYFLASSLKAQGERTKALQYAQRALIGLTKVLGQTHPHTQRSKRQVERLEKT